MAKKPTKTKVSLESPFRSGVGRISIGVLLVALGIFFALAGLGLTGEGPVGMHTKRILSSLLGAGYILAPLAALGTGISLFKSERGAPTVLALSGITLVTLSGLALLGTIATDLGGIFGSLLATPLEYAFGTVGGVVFLLALLTVGFVLLFRIEEVAFPSFVDFFSRIFRRGNREEEEEEVLIRPLKKTSSKTETEEDEEVEDDEEAEDVPEQKPKEPTIRMFGTGGSADSDEGPVVSVTPFNAEYILPPLSLLGKDAGKPGVGDVKANANIIKRTFQNFGISVEMDEVSIGPTVTRYAIKPAEGVRLSKIVGLQNNLELALAAHPVRIEAPIPGKSLVGIEVPNISKATIGLGGLIGAKEFQQSKKPLTAALGRDITGAPHYVNVAKMPHALIAGTTGSGKSVAMHAFIISLLYKNSPQELRFIMVDPKRVELTLYNKIPHLLTPVITEPKKAILALKWAAKEMSRRYDILQAESVRDIESYHQTVRGKDPEAEQMPYIVIVIDELADLMQAYPRELEASIVRLAQMSRAVGIHLLLSTQRPSVNVITGLIKANVPARFALQVSSQIDSRTILDAAGAEKLLGAGDMLYLASDMQKPVRVQTAYIAEAEVKSIVAAIAKQNAGDLASIDLSGGAQSDNTPNDAIMASFEDEDVDDDLYAEARAAVEEAGKASTSYLQRKLKIGYSRAARLMDILEEKGVIGAADGSKPREVLTVGGRAGNEDGEESEDV